jgi:3-oxoacyl-[acyl-carrier protein] reductase
MKPDRGLAVVTGASRGIGRAIAIALAGRGYDVVINYAKNVAAAEQVRAEIEAVNGARALVVQADISIAADRARLLDQTLSRFSRIDLLVNNAGIAPEVRADLLDATEQSFDRMIEVNLKGPYFLTQLIAKQMLRQQEERRGTGALFISPLPKIINITSISAYTASINRGDYCVAKAGLAMMTKLFAARLAGEGINVYEIRPGVIETDMTGPVKAKYDELILEKDLTPIPRWGQGEDVAKAVVAIATDLFPFTTGEVINVDGGFHLRRL